MIFKIKYIAVFLTKEQGSSYSIEGIKRFNPIIKKINFKRKAIPINSSNHSISKGLKKIFYIDISCKIPQQIFFNTVESEGINPDILDMLLNGHILRELTSNLTDNSIFKMNVLNMIIGGLIGGLIGFLIAQYISLPA